MRLFRVEVRRAMTRRSVRLVAVLAVLNVAVASVVVFIRHDTDDGARAKLAAAARAERDCLSGDLFPPGTPVTDEPARSIIGDPAPPLGGFRDPQCAVYREVLESDVRRFDLGRVGDVAETMMLLLLLIALVIGASLVGAEWGANTLATHLTWEPRRVRAYLTKALAAMTIAAALVIFTDLLIVGGLIPSAFLRGTTDVPSGYWGDVAGVVARGALGAGLLAGVGFAIAATTRSTVFAMGFTFLLFVLDSLVVARVMPELQRWSFFANLGGYISGSGIEAVVTVTEVIPGRSPGGAGILAASYVAVLLAGGTAVFRLRDIT